MLCLKMIYVLSPCWLHRGKSYSVSLPRPNMLTRHRTPTLWAILQTVLGIYPMLGCICTVYDCLGLQVAERRQMPDLCFPLVKCVSRELLFFFPSLDHINKKVSTATHFHTFPFRLSSLYFSLKLLSSNMYAPLFLLRASAWAQTDVSHLIRSNGVWQKKMT